MIAASAGEMKNMTKEEIINRINVLKKEKNAILLAHLYTLPEVQDVADYLGDSLGLSKLAGKTDADMIVFCGVQFMAETAAVISPGKTVLSPAPNAGCSLADSVTGEALRRWKEENPDGLVVSYVNTTAEVKAYTDYCCTSANALHVVESLPADKKILFGPDKNLGAWIMKKTGREMELWTGCCCVHDVITPAMIEATLMAEPEADILIHPEAQCSSAEEILNNDRVYFYSTSGMLDHVKKSSKKRFVIATELGIMHQLKTNFPGKVFVPLNEGLICHDMKKVTLEKVLDCLENGTGRVEIAQEILERAALPIQRMMEL